MIIIPTIILVAGAVGAAAIANGRRRDVCFFGLSATGKTTILKILKGDTVDVSSGYPATQGLQEGEKDGWWIFGDYVLRDCGGADDYRDQAKKAWESLESPVLVFVVDVSKLKEEKAREEREVFSRLHEDLDNIKLFAEKSSGEKTIVIIGTHGKINKREFLELIDFSRIKEKVGRAEEADRFVLSEENVRSFDFAKKSHQTDLRKWFKECIG